MTFTIKNTEEAWASAEYNIKAAIEALGEYALPALGHLLAVQLFIEDHAPKTSVCPYCKSGRMSQVDDALSSQLACHLEREVTIYECQDCHGVSALEHDRGT